MQFFSSTPITALFARSVDGLHKAVAARGAARAWMPAPLDGMLILLIVRLLSRVNQRVQALAARIVAGTLGPEPKPRQRADRKEPAADPIVEDPKPPTGEKRLRLPRKPGWLIGLVPYEAATYGLRFRHLLAEPPMAALLAATPRMVEALRPLCRMLDIEDALPPRPPRVKPAEPPAAPLSPDQPGAPARARRQATLAPEDRQEDLRRIFAPRGVPRRGFVFSRRGW